MPINVTAEPLVVTLSQRFLLSRFPPAPRDATLDQTYNCAGEDSAGNPDQGIPVATTTLLGSWLSRRWTASPLTTTTSIVWSGSLRPGIIKSGAGLTLTTELRGQLVTQGVPSGATLGSNWLRWSKIGALDFTIGRDNVAGQMPLPTSGAIYQILRRGESGPVLAYCRNGVFALTPVNTAYGFKQVFPIGLKYKLAVVDTGEAHFFIDTLGRLWRWGEGPQLLDYREWLSGLTNPVLSFNPDTRLLYICDGATGYVYNVDTGSMGKGPATVTGVGTRNGSSYVVASGTMTVPVFQITTDVTDLGSRHGKSISSLEVGVDTTLALSAAVDYRLKKQSAFSTTAWRTVDSRGVVYIPCYGYEFRFKVKAASAGWFHLDSLKVNGVIHAH